MDKGQILKALRKTALGGTALSGLVVGSVALANNTQLEQQSDEPKEFIQEPQTVEELKQGYKQIADGVSSVEKKLKELKDKQDEQDMDIQFNQGQIGRNQSTIIDLYNKDKQSNNNSFWITTLRGYFDKLNKKVNKLNVDLSKEKKEIEQLLDSMKEFEHYDRLDGFLTRLQEVTSRFNNIEERITSIENKVDQANAHAYQAFNEVQQAKGLLRPD